MIEFHRGGGIPKAAEMIARFGSLKRAFNLVQRETGAVQIWEESAQRRREDLLVYLNHFFMPFTRSIRNSPAARVSTRRARGWTSGRCGNDRHARGLEPASTRESAETAGAPGSPPFQGRNRIIN